MKNNKTFFYLFVLLALSSCVKNSISGQIASNPKDYDIKPFEATILNSDYSMAYSINSSN